MLGSCIVPKATIYASRMGMTNKYAYDYACEDEFFEREMTLYESKAMSLPLSDQFRHKSAPWDDIIPPHWNDVRFNYQPQFMDRRCYMHDFLPIFYNMEVDFHHGLGYADEDLDYEMPDPYSAMHFKNKRSQVIGFFGAAIATLVLIGYPVFGLKMPQRDHPTFWRKKFSTGEQIQAQMSMAIDEWGGSHSEMDTETGSYYGPKGFKQANNGIRFNVAGYKDLIV